MTTSEIITAPAVSSPVNPPAPSVPEISAHERAREIVKTLAETPAKEIPAMVAKSLREFSKFAPEKKEFSKVKELRKKEMADYRKAESIFRSAIGVIVRFAEDSGAEMRQKYGFSVSASGISTLSDSRKSVFKPLTSSRVSF